MNNQIRLANLVAETWPVDCDVRSLYDSDGSLVEGADCGDTLVLFVLRELQDFIDEDLDWATQCDEAITALRRAQDELEDVIDALIEAHQEDEDNPESAICPFCDQPTTDLTTLADHGCCIDCLHEWQFERLCLSCGGRNGEHDPDCTISQIKAITDLAYQGKE